MANTLDLDPEWGGIDLIEEIEEAFAIKVADKDAERCWTVGDLYEVICAHTPDWDERSGSCASSAVFYRLRQSLSPDDKRAISPRSTLQRAGEPPSRLLSSIRKDTGLRLPDAQPTTIGIIGGYMCLGGFIGGLVALFGGAWIWSGVGALIFALGAALIRVDPARLPVGVTTVGDLVRRAAPLNVRKLAEIGARAPDRWTILVALAAEHGSLAPAEIGPDTFLLRKGMDTAAARG